MPSGSTAATNRALLRMGAISLERRHVEEVAGPTILFSVRPDNAIKLVRGRAMQQNRATQQKEPETEMDRKELVRKYKETPRPAGLYRVRHTSSGRTLMGGSPDAPAMLNRIRAQLRMGGHPNRQLQEDWKSDGPDGFLFEVVDLLTPSGRADDDQGEDLRMLEELWREKLELHSEDSY